MYQDSVASIQERVYTEGYYAMQWEHVLKKLNITTLEVEKKTLSDRTLVLLCHYFWEALPDTMTIRNSLFFDICDIAEHIFDEV